jgi:hypothetical protein
MADGFYQWQQQELLSARVQTEARSSAPLNLLNSAPSGEFNPLAP